MKGLSKSRYTAFCQCAKRLWLAVNKPDVADPLTADQQARFDMGNEVGDLAMGLLGDYVEVTMRRNDGSLDLAAMVKRTEEEMARGTENICEASFSYDGNYCAVDILHKTPGGWAIYEVKSSSGSIRDSNKEFDKYVPDIAYQKWLLTQCGITVTGTYLVCLNSDYVRHGNPKNNLQHLFVFFDMQTEVDNELLKVPTNVALAMDALSLATEPDIDLHERCHAPYDCSFWGYCTRTLPQPSVFDVYGGKGRAGFTFKKKIDCYRAGDITFESLRTTPLGKIQDMQVACTLDGTEHIDKAGIRKFLKGLTYPLYFLDFESMQYAVPQYDNSKPYAQICFQYSLHIIERKGGPLEHKEYLAPGDGSDPRRGLAESLCRDIPIGESGGCVLVYNKSFECSRIKEMATLYPDLAARLMAIHDNIKDLLEPFRDGHYYVPAMGGSFSIKSVLPALFPNDPDLDYHALQGVQNGGDAMTIFPKMQSMSAAEVEATRKALLAYCCLDTLALVKVLERLEEVSN